MSQVAPGALFVVMERAVAASEVPEDVSFGLLFDHDVLFRHPGVRKGDVGGRASAYHDALTVNGHALVILASRVFEEESRHVRITLSRGHVCERNGKESVRGTLTTLDDLSYISNHRISRLFLK